MKYCAARSSNGWLCVLAEDHDGDHLSIDNSKQWKGTPGSPVWWPQRARESREATAQRKRNEDMSMLMDPTLTQAETSRMLEEAQAAVVKKNLPTGEACSACGSIHTVRTGTCLRCLDCYAVGECG